MRGVLSMNIMKDCKFKFQTTKETHEQKMQNELEK